MSEIVNEKQDRSMRSVVLGTSLIFWILAVFMINTMNSIRKEIADLKQYLEATAMMAGGGQLSNYQIADEEGKVVYSFIRTPDPEYDMMMGQDGCGAIAKPVDAAATEGATKDM